MPSTPRSNNVKANSSHKANNNSKPKSRTSFGGSRDGKSSDNRSSSGGSRDGRRSDNRSSSGGSRDGRRSDNRSSSGGSRDGRSSDNRSSFGGPRDGRRSDNRSSSGGSRDGRSSDNRSSSGGSRDGRSSDSRSSSGGSRDGRRSDNRSSSGGSRDGRSSDNRSSFGGSRDGRSSEGRSSFGGSRDGRSSDNRSSFGGSRDGRSSDNRSSFRGSRDEKGSDSRSSFKGSRDNKSSQYRRDDRRTDGGGRPSYSNHRRFKQPRYNTRAVAAEALTQILYRGRLSEDALNSGFAKIPKEDIKLLHSLCFGVLRWHGVLSEQALKLIGKQQADLHPKVQLILELGIWQLAMGYAEHASIHQCVDACEQVGLLRAKNFVNAILRKAQSAINDDGWKLQNQSYQFPEPLSNILLAQEFCQDPSLRLGAYTGQLVEQIQPIVEQIHNQLCQLQTTQPSISLRIQTNRIKPEKYQEQLSKLGIKSEIGCYENSLIIRQPIQVEKLPGYSVGAVVIQDMAAQCAAHILNPKAQMSVLDACAAPGGKASHLQELADNKLELIALEIDEYRSRRLRENFGRMRTNGKVVIGSAILPAEWWHGRAFDLILADVPCSGTGVMRRHPDIPWLRKKEEIIAHSAESLKMLNRLWSLLKEKGSLLFATCSVLPEENDFVIEQFLRQNNNAKKAEFSLPLPHLETIHGKQIIPQLDNDSLYYCLLTKEKPLL